MELSAQEKQRMDKLSNDDQLKLKAIMQMMAKEKDAIEKDARKAKGMMEDQSSITKEIGFHINAYKDGTIDVDDMIQAIEEIIYGKISAPGQTMEEQEMPKIVNSLEALITNHLKQVHQGAYRDDIVFIEKNTTDDYDWLRLNEVNSFPTILFFKDGELKYSRAHIMAQKQIMEVIEKI